MAEMTINNSAKRSYSLHYALKIKIFLLVVHFLFSIIGLKAQHYYQPPLEQLFTDTEVPSIYITIHPDSLELLYEDIFGGYQFPVTVRYTSSTINDSITNAGLGLRGNTSLFADKKSFQITFNALVPGQKFYGLEKMNLVGQHNDPAIIRTKLTWDVFNTFNVPSPRSNHVKVFINDEYYGLYVQVEHIDDEFCQTRFGNNDGNLYKCYYGASLKYISNNPNDYKFQQNGNRTYDLKTNNITDDYSDLANFIKILNNTPLSQLPCELEKVFNVHNYLKCMAIEILAGHWDNYIYNINNYYLYHNTETDRFEYIPYDVDNTWGIDWLNVNWTTVNIYQFKPSNQSRPLYDRILAIPRYKNLFSYYLDSIANSEYMNTEIFSQIQSIKSMITPAAQADYYRTLDYGFSMNDFNNSYSQALGGHVDHGIVPYIQQRIQSINQQLQLNNNAPELFYPIVHYPRPTDSLFFKCNVNDDVQINEVQLIYTLNGGANNQLILYDDGLHFDGLAGDKQYGNVLILPLPNTTVQYSFSASDNSSLISTLPVCDVFNYLHRPIVSSVVINEFMADNILTYLDSYGEDDDWIELYNAGNEPVSLKNMFLSDQAETRNKWPLPDYTLNPNAYVIVWCDKDGYQGNLHTNFKLAKSGGAVILSEPYSNSMAITDYVTYTQQLTNKSYSRMPNGTGSFVIQSGTPMYNNESSSASDPDYTEIQLYPNPAMFYCQIQARSLIQEIRLIDNLGKVILTRFPQQDKFMLPLNQVPAGFYTAQFIFSHDTIKQIPLIIIK